jgi:hypothetical protein
MLIMESQIRANLQKKRRQQQTGYEKTGLPLMGTPVLFFGGYDHESANSPHDYFCKAPNFYLFEVPRPRPTCLP